MDGKSLAESLKEIDVDYTYKVLEEVNHDCDSLFQIVIRVDVIDINQQIGI